jgi:hypothetical protein
VPTYAFTVGGVTKQLRAGWTITESANSLDRMDFALVSLDGSYRAVNDQEVILTEDGTRIFGGLIDRPSEAGVVGANAWATIEQRLSAVDFNIYAHRIRLTAEIPAGTYKAFLTVVANALTAQGVTLDAGQVNGPNLPALSYNDAPIVDVLNEGAALASADGATSWVWNIGYTKVLSSVEAGSEAAPFNIAANDDQVVGDVTVEQPRPSDYANYITLLGGSGTRDVEDTFTGDGVEDTFALTIQLATSYGYVTVNGVAETLGTGATWEYDGATNSITRSSPTAAAASIVMTYVGQYPKAVTADGGAAAANRVQKTYAYPDIYDATVMQLLADSLLVRDMSEPKTARYAAAYSKTGLHPGQVQTITLPKRNLTGSHLFTAVQIRHIPGHTDLVQRTVTAVTTTRLPSTLREKYQQTFGSRGGGGAAGSVTVVTGGTYLTSPVFLGGGDTLFRSAADFVRVPNAVPFVAPATIAVRLRASIAASGATNVTLRLYDLTAGAAAFTGSAVAATSTPADYTPVTGSVTVGHQYILQMKSSSATVSVAAFGQLESA